MAEDTFTCRECPTGDAYEGDIKGLCSHIGKAHDISWAEYRDQYGIDDTELRRRNRRNSRSGWWYKKRHEDE